MVASSGRFKRLVLIRDEQLRINPTAKATHDRVHALRQAGHTLLRPPAEAYAAIAAARQLLADAAAGHLCINGKGCGTGGSQGLARRPSEHPSRRVLSALDSTENARSDDVIERVRELLEGQWVVPATGIAASMGLDEAALIGHLTSQQHTIGVFIGSPTVLFLRPESLCRE